MLFETLPSLQAWSWFAGALQQYHTAFLLLAEVFTYPMRREADRIWTVLDYVFEVPSQLSRDQKARLILTEIRDRMDAYRNARKLRAPTTMMRRLGVAPPRTKADVIAAASGGGRGIVQNGRLTLRAGEDPMTLPAGIAVTAAPAGAGLSAEFGIAPANEEDAKPPKELWFPGQGEEMRAPPEMMPPTTVSGSAMGLEGNATAADAVAMGLASGPGGLGSGMPAGMMFMPMGTTTDPSGFPATSPAPTAAFGDPSANLSVNMGSPSSGAGGENFSSGASAAATHGTDSNAGEGTSVADELMADIDWVSLLRPIRLLCAPSEDVSLVSFGSLIIPAFLSVQPHSSYCCRASTGPRNITESLLLSVLPMETIFRSQRGLRG